MNEFLMKYAEKYVLLEQDKSTLVSIVEQLQSEIGILTQEKIRQQEEYQKKDKKHQQEMEVLKNRYVDAKLEAERYRKIVDLKLGHTYKTDAPWIDKIVYVLREAQRPLKSVDIIEILSRNDIVFRETINDKVKMLSRYLYRGLEYGKISGDKLPGNNGYLYSLPTDFEEK